MNIAFRYEYKTSATLIRKLFLVFLVTFTLLLAGASLLTYLYQDQLVKHFVTQANQFLATPVKVKNIKLSFWHQFPQVAITLEDVKIMGSQARTNIQTNDPGQEVLMADSLLAQAAQLDFTFNLWHFLQGEYVIDQIYLTHSEVMLDIDKQGETNYNILKKRADTHEEADTPLRFQLQKISLKDVKVSYADQLAKQHHQLLAQDVEAQLDVIGEQYDIRMQGDVLSHFIQIGPDAFFQQKPLRLATQLYYDFSQRHLRIDSTRIGLGSGNFIVSGTVDQANDNFVDLQIHGERTDLQTLLSLLPQSFSQQWQAYRSEGEAHFQGTVQGKVSRTHNPLVELQFGARQASFYHPDYQKRMQDIQLEGSFTNGKTQSLRSSVLELKNIAGQLDGRPISGSLSLSNFENYYLRCQVKTHMDINSLFAFYPLPEIKAARGEIDADFEISGWLQDLKGESRNYWQRIKSQGDISLQNVDLLWQADRLPIQKLNGNLLFKGNDLSISDMEGYVGNSHMVLNGMLRNAFAYLLSDTQPVHIEADLYSRQIDMDEMLSGNATEENTSANWQEVTDKQAYRFDIDPKLHLDFNCKVDKIKFRRFRGKNLRGKLEVEHQIAKLNHASILTAGGKVSAQAFINARRPDMITVKANSAFEHLRADSIFYTFEEFGQDFLTSRHLEGKIYADVDWDLSFDHSLQLDYTSLKVDALTTIRDGRLNNFEPMQKLARFVEEESLSRLRFADLNNHIRIQDQKIWIPRMQVSSNVSEIWVEGVHTFDNHIDYRFEVPMKTFSIRKAAARERAKAREQQFGELLDEDAAPLQLYLKAEGTVDDYKISYDMQAAKTKLKDNLQNEKEEFRQIIKNKGSKPAYQLELDDDEYFDFEEKTSSSQQKP